jgi:heme oxygenase (staphylobilin-producing)
MVVYKQLYIRHFRYSVPCFQKSGSTAPRERQQRKSPNREMGILSFIDQLDCIFLDHVSDGIFHAERGLKREEGMSLLISSFFCFILSIDDDNHYQYNGKWETHEKGGRSMFVQMRSITVKEGYSDQVVERFSKAGVVDRSPGLIDITVLVKRTRREDEEVVVFTRWESEEAWKNWEKSDAHIQGHRENRGKPTPEFIVGTNHGLYDVRAVRNPIHE